MLNKEQLLALEWVKRGKNIFVTAPGGYGKTYWINYVAKFLSECQNKNIAKTSMTGSSAILINGSTLHSYLGIGICKDKHDIIRRVRKLRKTRIWIDLDVLIIDEISMMSKELFESLDEVARDLCNNPRPFGGIQIILCGDFCQLGCIDSKNFCFESLLWKSSIHETVFFTTSYRQTNLEFCKMLEEIRFGNVTKEIEQVLNSRIMRDHIDNGIEPTRLFGYKRDVEDINTAFLRNLIDNEKKDIHKFHIKSKYKKNILKRYIPDDSSLCLCIGCQVILTVNLDIDNGLINGSRGIITNFTSTGLPIVTFMNGLTLTIDYFLYTIEDKSVEICSYSQIPLILGWAITIHKSQGMTLDCVLTDLSNIFDYGQAYVTLSRVKNLDCLYILDIDYSKIKCNPKVISYYQTLSSKIG